MLNRLRERMGRDEGFTLIELLVVMLILGILAAIAIPSFFAQRDKARDADAKAQVRTAQTAIETYATDNGDAGYAGATEDTLAGIEETLSSVAGDPATAADGDLEVVAATEDAYTLTMTEPSTTHTFTIDRADTGGVTLSCTPTTGAGGCPNGGDWSGS